MVDEAVSLKFDDTCRLFCLTKFDCLDDRVCRCAIVWVSVTARKVTVRQVVALIKDVEAVYTVCRQYLVALIS